MFGVSKGLLSGGTPPWSTGGSGKYSAKDTYIFRKIYAEGMKLVERGHSLPTLKLPTNQRVVRSDDTHKPWANWSGLRKISPVSAENTGVRWSGARPDGPTHTGGVANIRDGGLYVSLSLSANNAELLKYSPAMKDAPIALLYGLLYNSVHPSQLFRGRTIVTYETERALKVVDFQSAETQEWLRRLESIKEIKELLQATGEKSLASSIMHPDQHMFARSLGALVRDAMPDVEAIVFESAQADAEVGVGGQNACLIGPNSQDMKVLKPETEYVVHEGTKNGKIHVTAKAISEPPAAVTSSGDPGSSSPAT